MGRVNEGWMEKMKKMESGWSRGWMEGGKDGVSS